MSAAPPAAAAAAAVPATAGVLSPAAALDAVSAIIAQCGARGQRWSDPDFVPSAAAICPPTSPNASLYTHLSVDWPRAFSGGADGGGADAKAGGVERLFGGHDPSPTSIVQGKLGDCYVIAALSLVATHPPLIRRLCLTATPLLKGAGASVSAETDLAMALAASAETVGVAAFQLFSGGDWKAVVIDDCIPCAPSFSSSAGGGGGGAPLFAHIRPPSGSSKAPPPVWLPLLEKALAKRYGGSYDALRGGSISEALVDLTGAPVEDFNLTKPENKGTLPPSCARCPLAFLSTAH
jgi:hypothetical protein